MTHLQSTASISAPDHRVWTILSDVARWPEWTPSVTRVAPLDQPCLEVGARFMIHQPRLRPAIWKVTEVRAPHRFVWESRSPGVKVVAEHDIEPCGQEGCRLTLRIAFSGVLAPIIGRVGRALTEHYMALEAAGLKRRAQAGGDTDGLRSSHG